MFERWRQENFFKYMREEFLLDTLIDYQIEPEDPTRTIPNPKCSEARSRPAFHNRAIARDLRRGDGSVERQQQRTRVDRNGIWHDRQG